MCLRWASGSRAVLLGCPGVNGTHWTLASCGNLQCAEGYHGYLCGLCDTRGSISTGGQRYGYRGQFWCGTCRAKGWQWAQLVLGQAVLLEPATP